MKKILYTFFIFCFTFQNIKAINISNKIIEEVLSERASSIILFKNDSLFKKKYDEIYNNIKEEKYVIALKEVLKLQDEARNYQDKYWVYKTHILTADLYYRTKRYNQSIEFYKESLVLIENQLKEEKNINLKDIDLAKSFLNLANTYFKLFLSKKDKIDNQYIANNIDEKNNENYLDSAVVYYKRVESFPALNKDIELIKAKAFNSLSGIYEFNSNYEKAEDYVLKAIKVYKENNNTRGGALALNNLGNIFISQEKFKKAKSIYLQALKLIKNNNNANVIGIKASLYSNLAWAMRKLEDFKAFDYQEESYEIQVSIREKEFRGLLEQVKGEYDLDVQKSIFEKQEENRRLIAQRKFILFGIIALLVILSLIYILKVNRLKQNNLALQLQRTELLKNKELDKLKSESQTRIINATIDGKESERKQIAETLHDSVSALLSSANLHLQATRKQFNGSTPIEIDKTQEIILEATHKIRDLSHTLVSSVLLKFGLKFAVVDISEKYSNSELTISTEINNIRRYHQNFEIKIYNILQEFLNNILKHSKAKSALIKLKEENECLFITIKDDGVGFDKTKVDENDGLGINQIDARVKMLKGCFNIESSEGNGAKIYVKIPIVEKEKSTHVFPIQ